MVQVVPDAINSTHNAQRPWTLLGVERWGNNFPSGLLHPFCGQVRHYLLSSHSGETLVAVIY